jgi:hypothetical protein
MGQLTDWALEYRAGSISLEDLKERVTGFEFTPHEMYSDQADDPFEAARHASDRMRTDETDTPYELYMLDVRGLLSREELSELVHARSACQSG